MKNGIIGWPCVAYAVAAAVKLDIDPASVMPFLEDLSGLRLDVRHQRLDVDGFVALSERVVDLQLP